MSKVIAVVGGSLLAILMLGMVAIVAAIGGGGAAQAACDGGGGGGGGGGGPLPAPPPGDLSGGQMVRYFVQAGDSPNAAAGIVGNLVQESSLQPTSSDRNGGGGLAQWNSSWYHSVGPQGTLALDAFAAAHHVAPDSDQAQLAFIAYDLNTGDSFYLAPPQGTLQSNLQSAPDPATAATMFETGYEGCSGVTGWMQVIPGSLCDDSKRRNFAQEALQQAHLNSRTAGPTGINKRTGIATSTNSSTATTVGQTLSEGALTPPPGVTCSPTATVGSAPITNGPTGRILPNGIAEAPRDAPPQVRKMIAAGNAIVDTFYSQERRPGMLDHVQDSYDCSGSTDFVLYNGGFSDSPAVNPYGTATAGDATMLDSFGLPGRGRWVDVFWSSAHAFIIVAGLALDTSHQGLPYEPTTVPYNLEPGDTNVGGPDSGPRWFIASQILPPQMADGLDWHERHPRGL